MSHRPSTPAGLAVAALAALLTGCGASDVVAKYAAISFEAVAEASKDRVAYAEQEAAWSLGSPGGDSIAFSSDFSRGPAEGKGSPIMDAPDIEMAFDLAPLAAAGLDPKRLPEPSGGDTVAYAVEDGTFMIHAELGNEAFPAEAAKSIEATFAAILKTHRSAIGYHEKLAAAIAARDEEEARKLKEDAKIIEKAGVFAIVLEKIPAALAGEVAESVKVPVIGIGAGRQVDGQVLVLHDMLGINMEFSPRFLRRYHNLYDEIKGAVHHYISDVRSGDFPNEKEQY